MPSSEPEAPALRVRERGAYETDTPPRCRADRALPRVRRLHGAVDASAGAPPSL